MTDRDTGNQTLDDLGDLSDLESAVDELRFTPGPFRHRRWPIARPLIAALVTLVAVVALLDRRRVPLRAVGLFAGEHVTYAHVLGGSKLVVDVSDRDQTVAELAERFRSRGLDVVEIDGDRMTLLGLFAPERELYKHLFDLPRPTFRPVVRTEVVSALAEANGAAEHVYSESWQHEASGRELDDVYVTDATPEKLRALLARFGPPGPGLTFGWGRNEAPDEPGFRSYVLGPPFIFSSAVKSARIVYDPETNRPVVLIEFNDFGGRSLGEHTAAHQGEKLAIVAGSEVIVAGTIQSRIDNGQLQLSMGAGDRSTLEAEANALVRTLEREPQPGKLVSIEEFKPIGAPVIAARLFCGGLLALLAFVLVWVFERQLARSTAVSRTRGVRPRRAPFIRKLAVSATCAAATIALSRASLGPVFTDDFLLGMTDAIGLLPFLVGFVVAGALATLHPKLRSRSRRQTVALVAGLALLLLACGSLLDSFYSVPLPLTDDWRWFALPVLLASVALYALAQIAGRWGISNGFVLVIASMELARIGRFTDPSIAGEPLITVLVATVVSVVLTSYVLRARFAIGGGQTRRVALAGAAPGIIAIAAGLAMFHVSVPISWLEHTALAGGAMVVAALLVAMHLRGVRGRGARVVNGTRSISGLVGATGVGLGYAAALAYLFWWGFKSAGFAGVVGPLFFAFATAAVFDLVAELRAQWRNPELVVAARLDDPRLADPIADALAHAGIDVHMRDQYCRHLLGPFGGFIPILVTVPAHRRDEAVAVIDGQR